MNDTNKGETVENWRENSKKSKKSSKSKTKFEERENEKETLSDLIFSEECEISPETILIKEIKTSNNKYLYKKYLNIKIIKTKKRRKRNVEIFYWKRWYIYIYNFF